MGLSLTIVRTPRKWITVTESSWENVVEIHFTVSTGRCYKLTRNVVTERSDVYAARNVLARLHDPGIDRWTPYQKVKSILLKRTERHRLGLLNPDSSCNSTELSTESELPKNVQLCRPVFRSSIRTTITNIKLSRVVTFAKFSPSI